MSKAEILEELPRLKPEERHEVLERIYQIEKIAEDEWLDADDPLTEAEKALQWQTTSARCVTGGGFFPQETSDEMENEFKDLAVFW